MSNGDAVAVGSVLVDGFALDRDATLGGVGALVSEMDAILPFPLNEGRGDDLFSPPRSEPPKSVSLLFSSYSNQPSAHPARWPSAIFQAEVQLTPSSWQHFDCSSHHC